MVAVIVTAVAFVHASQASQAKTFKSSEFLKWSDKSQSFYFDTSVMMAGVIAAQNSREQAQCIDRWYLGEDKKRNEVIQKAMRTYPTYHPQAVILGVLQKACGSFRYTTAR